MKHYIILAQYRNDDHSQPVACYSSLRKAKKALSGIKYEAARRGFKSLTIVEVNEKINLSIAEPIF